MQSGCLMRPKRLGIYEDPATGPAAAAFAGFFFALHGRPTANSTS